MLGQFACTVNLLPVAGCAQPPCPPTTVHNRVMHWSARDVRQRRSEKMAVPVPMPKELSLGSTQEKVHHPAQSTREGRGWRR
jgi:hypothetical protein